MKTLQASNLKQAIKELKELDEKLVDKLNGEIKDADKRHYHVILVTVTDRPGQAKNLVKFTVQTYHKEGYEKVKKNYFAMGKSNVILLHDPSTLSAEELAPKSKTPATPVAPVVDTKKDETISAQAQEIADLKAKLAEKATPVAPVVDTKEKTTAPDPTENVGDVNGSDKKEDDSEEEFDVEKANFADLNKFAAANKINLGPARNTAEIRAAVKTWIEKQN